MKINSIKIENLFDIFNYDISFKKDENVLIITGPNGFGKTMILNIIFNLFNRQFLFFQKLVFEKITLCLDENIKIVISKKEDEKQQQLEFEEQKLPELEKNKIKEKINIRFVFLEKGIGNVGEREIGMFDYSNRSEAALEHNIQNFLPVRRMSSGRWRDLQTDKIFTTDELLFEYSDQLPDEISKNILSIKSERINQILDSIQVHIIKEQRLFKRAYNIERNYREEKEQTVMTETIQTYAKELYKLILDFSQKSFVQTQELDSSYPKRLTSEVNILSGEDYEVRYNKLKIKQKKLTEFGLYESEQEFLAFSPEDAKALSVYLKDFELKLGVFDALLEKLEIFTNILNERRFTFKTIKINRRKGFYFETSKGIELELNQLSSGEQHEVVLLYELIFNVKPNVLVLIDEPEISLHITWQKEFLNDLLRIIKIQNIQVLIATHSPSIINDRWDLVYNLETPKK